jgi:hypothetical protein
MAMTVSEHARRWAVTWMQAWGGLDAKEIVTLYATEAILATEFESRPG